ncbi:MAG: aminoacyl-tRNA hydrolase [Cutibacterium granulosum]|nr:aminoacyl-tRNA hydrolase [Cutibacterium granulosum]
MSWLIAGLGNPGPVYTRTRHNVGYLVVDELRRRANERWTSARAQRADVVRTRTSPVGLGAPGAQTEPVVLMRSRTYMNESGIAVRKVANFSHISPDHLIVVHDELDLDLGRMRLKAGGGDNGHNGLKSIRAHLRTGDFNRVRFGVGRPPGRMNPADYVLSNFPARDQNDLDLQVTLAADAVEMIMTDGLTAAQNRYNT